VAPVEPLVERKEREGNRRGGEKKPQSPTTGKTTPFV